MTPGAQRIAIAEACPNLFDCVDGGVTWSEAHPVRDCYPVDPLNDLNAMHEAEKLLDEAQMGAYAGLVYYSVARDNKERRYGIHATAAQRAEAFLRALNLWTDSK